MILLSDADFQWIISYHKLAFNHFTYRFSFTTLLFIPRKYLLLTDNNFIKSIEYE